MAIYSHMNRSIEYRIYAAPVSQDVLLLQSEKFNVDFWRPVIKELETSAPGAGRLMVCDWFTGGGSASELSESLKGLIDTVGLHSLRVVACAEAVAVVEDMQKQSPGLIEKTLLYRQHLPAMAELGPAIREFLQT